MPPQNLKEKILEVSTKRLKKCHECEFHSKNAKGVLERLYDHCTLCKCPDKSKTSCLSCSCALAHAEKYGLDPLKYKSKWDAELSVNEEDLLDKELLGTEEE